MIWNTYFRLTVISNWSHLQSTRGADWEEVTEVRLIVFLDKGDRRQKPIVYKAGHTVQRQNRRFDARPCRNLDYGHWLRTPYPRVLCSFLQNNGELQVCLPEQLNTLQEHDLKNMNHQNFDISYFWSNQLPPFFRKAKFKFWFYYFRPLNSKFFRFFFLPSVWFLHQSSRSHYLVWKKKSQIYINSVNFPNAGGGELVVTTISFKFLFFIFLAIDFQPSFYPQFT